MTPNEMQALACGLALGAWIVVLVQTVTARSAARRAAARARRITAGDLYYGQFRLARTEAQADRLLDRYRSAA
jgi:hypothetical protein